MNNVGDTRIVHLGYGFYSESRWNGDRWVTSRSDGPYKSAGFTAEERARALKPACPPAVPSNTEEKT